MFVVRVPVHAVEDVGGEPARSSYRRAAQGYRSRQCAGERSVEGSHEAERKRDGERKTLSDC